LNHRFDRQVALPVATLIAAAMLAVVIFVNYSASRQSEDAYDQSMRAIRSALATKLEEVARTTQDYARWNDSVRHLDLAFDPDWADKNVGPYIFETFGYDVTFVIGRDDGTRYISVGGERRTANAFQVAPGLDQLVARAPSRATSSTLPRAILRSMASSPWSPPARSCPSQRLPSTFPQGGLLSWSMPNCWTVCLTRWPKRSGYAICSWSRRRRRSTACCR
jgi:hypothetical protein